MHSRVAIIGNAGSGKSYLAAAIRAAWGLPIINLDTLFWMPGGYVEQRPKDAVRAEIEKTKTDGCWTFEGVYGELIDLVLDRSEYLVWLDIDWDTCRQALWDRHLLTTEKKRGEMESSFKELLDYASDYSTREGPRSHRGHQSLFTGFAQTKLHLRSRDEISDFVRALSTRSV